MSDLYSELLVQRKPSGKDTAIRIALYAATALFVAAGLLINPIILIGAVVFGVIDYIFIPKLDVEFEYLHVNDELDVDRIFSKMKRKKAMTIDLNKTEVLAPLGSHQLDSYSNAKVIDFSANDPDQKPYVLVMVEDNEQKKILLQLNAKMFQDIKRRMPRKVFEY